MDHTTLDHLGHAQLAKLLDADRLPEWSEADKAEILGHQLAAPLLPDLAMIPGAETVRLQALVRDRPGAESFLRQLTFITPSLELLIAIKGFARHFRDVRESPLHGMPATILYYAAIAAALARCKARITRLHDADLRTGFTWAKQQPAAEPLITIFTAAQEQLAQD